MQCNAHIITTHGLGRHRRKGAKMVMLRYEGSRAAMGREEGRNASILFIA